LNSSLTCLQALSGATQNTAQTNCTVSTATHAVTYTATVEDATHKLLSGVTVNFAATSATLGGTAVTGTSLPSGTGTTGANGQATFVVNDPSAANGDSAVVTATVGATAIGTATVHWATPHATLVSVVPSLQSVQLGGTVTVKATVTDQFGTAVSAQPALAYVVTGRNLGKSGAPAADGTITYVDAGTVPGTKSDTITVTDVADTLTGTATVSYVASTTATAVTVDTSGLGTSDAACGATGHTGATGVASGGTTWVCAQVKNATGEPLAGKPVTFTVDNGQVAAHGGLTAASTTTYAATTDVAGVAFADVSSTKAGTQTVTATADTATGTGTVTYVGPQPADAYTVAVTPATATVAPSSSQKFVATVTDKNGNPVPGVTVVYTQSGAGSVGNGGNTAITAADGTVNVTVTTAANDSGPGTLAFSIGAAPTVANQCATTGGTCTASATYTVAATGATGLSLKAPAGGNVGGTENLTATATNANGTAAANQLVRFYVGVNGKAVSIGSGTTGPAGKTTVKYTPTKAGKVTFAAFVDSNGNQIRESTEPTASATSQIRAVERPGLRLVSGAKNAKTGTVTFHVSSHPAARNALVRYYVKRNGTWHQIGTSTTGPGGNASKTFTRPKGARLTFRASVAHTPSTTFANTPARTITVR
jgi:adhesin/invasin